MVDFSSTTFTGTEGQGVSVCVEVLSGSVGRPQGVMVGLSATDETTTGRKGCYVDMQYIFPKLLTNINALYSFRS